MQSRWIMALIVSAVCARSVCAQNASSAPVRAGSVTGSTRFGVPAPFPVAGIITGAPYSAEEIQEQFQTLADGTRITRNQPTSKVFRDSMGRMRIERAIVRPLRANRPGEQPAIIEITDPVAKVKYVLEPAVRVAHRQQLPEMPAPTRGAIPSSGVVAARIIGPVPVSAGVAGAAADVPAVLAASADQSTRPQVSREDLGTRTIEGVLATGRRTTTVWPVDSQGNDRPLSVVNEMWTAPELRLLVLSRVTDPRSGENTIKLVNISRSEPSPSLFQPPPDYSIVDEAGAFSVQW